MRSGALAFVLFLAACGGETERKGRANQDHFWSLAEKLRQVAPQFQNDFQAAKRFYRGLKPEELAAFWDELQGQMDRSYRQDVWAVGAIIQGHVELDFFSGYQIWLVLQGKEFYEAVLKDPTRAVEKLPSDAASAYFDFTFFETGAASAYEERGGRKLPRLNPKERALPSGTPWKWRDLKALYPGLWKKYFLERDRHAPMTDVASLKDEDLWEYAVRPLHHWVDFYGDPDYLLEQYRLLSSAQRGLHAVWWMKLESDNGGIDQFFHNPTGMVAPEALDGLKLFGAKEHYEELSRIMKAFPGGSPCRDVEERQAQMEKTWSGTIDKAFPGTPKGTPLENIVARYIRNHPVEFFRSR